MKKALLIFFAVVIAIWGSVALMVFGSTLPSDVRRSGHFGRASAREFWHEHRPELEAIVELLREDPNTSWREYADLPRVWVHVSESRITFNFGPESRYMYIYSFNGRNPFRSEYQDFPVRYRICDHWFYADMGGRGTGMFFVPILYIAAFATVVAIITCFTVIIIIAVKKRKEKHHASIP